MRCYICRKKISVENAHHHYKRMCRLCGDVNLEKRNEVLESKLDGYTALVTGGRIKIGYETALKLLRSGAFVVVTTRFPVDAVKRYSNEHDFDSWQNRLRVYQIDFRQMQSLFELVNYLYTELGYLDILINNAAQTVRYPYEYYQKLVEYETDLYASLSETQKSLIVWSWNSESFDKLQCSLDSLLPATPLQIKGECGTNELEKPPKADLKRKFTQVDKFPKNSWTAKACDISLIELLEVQLVNVTTPYFLCTNLRKLMEASPRRYKHIVNVSAMEGKFSKKNKNCFHPHTNMAKAALNMLTRTSAQDFIKSGIIMNSVDTGWITDENPDWLRTKNEKRGLLPPLDAKDGAGRLCDPIFLSINGEIYGEEPESGLFLKDYFKKIEW